jgi:hypothetical protein
MRRFLFIILAGIVCIAILFFLKTKNTSNNKPVEMPAISPTNGSLPAVTTLPPKPTVNISSQKLLNANKTRILADWTNAIPGFKVTIDSPYVESLIMEQRDTNKCPKLLLTGDNGQSVTYIASFITLEIIKPDERIRRVEIQTPFMNIDETREMGSQLCNLLNVDSKDFLAWCDKVGNHAIDAPLFSTGNHLNGFGIHRTFNNQSPWYINYVIPY